MNEQTDTHRRCKTCREWKWLTRFEGGRRECRACRIVARRKRYATFTNAELDALLERQLANERRNRARHNERQIEKVRFYLTMLMERGWSLGRIGRESGVCRGTSSKVLRGKRSYVQTSTIDKLRDTFMREVARP